MIRFVTRLAAAAMALAGAAQAQDQGQPPLDRFDISINAENEAEQSTIVTLATTFAMMAPQTSGVRKASRLDFRSGTGLIEVGVGSEKLRAQMPEQLGQSVGRLTSMASPCDISRHRFDDIDVLVAVHNADNAQPQDAHRCFVAALWIYHAGGDQGVNVENWRVPYARIIGSAAAGRPAFAGFEMKEN